MVGGGEGGGQNLSAEDAYLKLVHVRPPKLNECSIELAYSTFILSFRIKINNYGSIFIFGVHLHAYFVSKENIL